MNLHGFSTLALAAETQDPPTKLTQDPTFDLFVATLSLALLLILVGYTQFSMDGSPLSRPSSRIPAWLQVIGVIVVLVIMIIIKNS